MTKVSDTRQRSPLIETRSIDYIPEAERHGSLYSQFTLWLGANLQITAIVTGALAVCWVAMCSGHSLVCWSASCSAARWWRCTLHKDPSSGCRR